MVFQDVALVGAVPYKRKQNVKGKNDCDMRPVAYAKADFFFFFLLETTY